MTRRMLTAIVASIFAGVVTALAPTALAQSNPPPAPAQSATTVTLIGCVAKVPAAVAGRPTPAVPSGVTHILTDAEAGGSSPVARGRGAAPPATPQPPMVIEPQYWLKTATTTILLTEHETHRVEVVGTPTVIQPAAGAPGRSTAPPTPNSPTSLLTITSLKMLSTECK